MTTCYLKRLGGGSQTKPPKDQGHSQVIGHHPSFRSSQTSKCTASEPQSDMTRGLREAACLKVGPTHSHCSTLHSFPTTSLHKQDTQSRSLQGLHSPSKKTEPFRAHGPNHAVPHSTTTPAKSSPVVAPLCSGVSHL